MAEPIPTVDYTFDVQGGPNPQWQVRRFHLTEGISQPFELVVDVLTEDTAVDPEELLGASARLDIDRHEVMRQVAGLIDRVDYVGVNVDRKLALRIHVVPALRILAQQSGSRTDKPADGKGADKGTPYPEWDYRESRYKRNWSWVQEKKLAESNMKTWYTPGPEGYVDYPAYGDAKAA